MARYLVPLAAALLLAACSEDQTVPTTCNADIDCPAGKTCQAGTCADPTVEPPPACTTSADCADGQACREGVCKAAACVNDGECEVGEECRSGACTLAGCRTSADCPEGRVCRTETHSCVQCGSDAECPDDKPVCRSDGTCIQCNSDADCGAPLPGFCNRATGSCVHCLKNDQCPSGLTCSAGNNCVGKNTNDPCDNTSLCAAGNICVNVGQASQCLQRCDAYAPDCGVGKVCIRLGDGAGGLIFEGNRPVGVCYTPAPGAAGLGDSCGGNVACQYNLYCVPDGYGSGRCRRLCDPNAATSPCQAPETCNTVPAGFSEHEVLGICYPPSDWNKSCADDAGCGQGFACAISTDPTEWDGFGLRCQYAPAAATQGPNGACSADTDCKSGFCLSDSSDTGMFCYGACDEDSDCPNGFCDDYIFTVDAVGNTVTLPGCHIGCNSNTECGSYGSAVCTPLAQGTTALRGECRQPYGTTTAPGKGVGAACTTITDCASARCELTDGRGLAQSGYCTTLCNVDADCAGGLVCPTDGVVVRLGNGTDAKPGTADDALLTTKMCAGAACDEDADCTGSGLTACKVELSPAAPKSGLTLRCGPPSGAVAGGAPCAKDADCASGLCFDPGSGATLCFAACDPGAATNTCPSGLTCQADIAKASALDGSTVLFAACAPERTTLETSTCRDCRVPPCSSPSPSPPPPSPATCGCGRSTRRRR